MKANTRRQMYELPYGGMVYKGSFIWGLGYEGRGDIREAFEYEGLVMSLSMRSDVEGLGYEG
jgi:hypothetical protein